MKHLSLTRALEIFNTLFDAAQHEMFKVEVLQDYTAVDDGPSLRAWLAGNKQRSRELVKKESMVAYRNKCLKSLATITRVHIVRKPYTPYLEWEIAVCYKDSLLAYEAESILLVNADTLSGITVPAGDFWIFDNKRVLQWEYEHGLGKTTGAQVWDEDQGDSIDYFCNLKAHLLGRAIPVV